MSVRIRLRRMGVKKRPFYRFVAADSRSPRDGRFNEILGYYDPIETPAQIGVKEDRVYYWLKQGALPTETVNALFRQIGLISKWEKMKKGEDVSGIELSQTIRERKKKKKTKKRVVKAEAPESKEEEVKEEPQPKPEGETPEEEKKEPERKAEKEKEEKKEVKAESEGKKSSKKEAETKTEDSEKGKS